MFGNDNIREVLAGDEILADDFNALRDALGQMNSGPNTMCLPWGSVDAGEVIQEPETTRFAFATTTAAVATADATFDVKLVIPCDGSTRTGNGSTSGTPYLTVKSDGYKIASGTKGSIKYVYDGTTGSGQNYDGTTSGAPEGWFWYADNFREIC